MKNKNKELHAHWLTKLEDNFNQGYSGALEKSGKHVFYAFQACHFKSKHFKSICSLFSWILDLAVRNIFHAGHINYRFTSIVHVDIKKSAHKGDLVAHLMHIFTSNALSE